MRQGLDSCRHCSARWKAAPPEHIDRFGVHARAGVQTPGLRGVTFEEERRVKRETVFARAKKQKTGFNARVPGTRAAGLRGGTEPAQRGRGVGDGSAGGGEG